MSLPPASITTFISENQIASICFTTEKNKPYCITCFYCFDKENLTLVFKSSYGSLHQNFIQIGNTAAGTIVSNNQELAKLSGIQFSGKIVTKVTNEFYGSTILYYKKFPFASVIPGELWGIKLEFLKLTNNTLGFGTKTTWGQY